MSDKISAVRGARKPKNSLKRQRIAVIILVAVAILLVVALFVVQRIVKNLPIELVDPNDGAVYYIKNVDGVYALYNKSGEICERAEDSYYITLYGTRVHVDAASGQYFFDSDRVPVFQQLFYNAYNSNGTSRYSEDRIIDKITVSNMEGEYSFVRKTLNQFMLEGNPDVQFTNEAFVSLTMACAYSLPTITLESPVTLPDGGIDWHEYGLASEERVRVETDEDGNETDVKYNYSPAKVTLTTKNGDEYVLYFGDPTVTGKSYYVKYEKENKVFVFGSTAIADYILQGVEAVITPSIVYPMNSTDYVQVEDFIIYESIDYTTINIQMWEKFGDFDREHASDDEVRQYDSYYAELLDKHSKKACHFSFWDLYERQNSMYESHPYVSHLEYSSGYYINSTNVSLMLQKFYETTFVGTEKLNPSADELDSYGLLTPDRVITFDYLFTNSEGKDDRVSNKVYISSQNPDGSYYAYSDMYDMIVCVDESSFNFLSWNELDWCDPSYMQHNINHITNIKIESPSTNINFTLDNSLTPDGNLFPLTSNKFNDSNDNSYEITEGSGGYSISVNGEALSPVYNSDYLVVGMPIYFAQVEGSDPILTETKPMDANGDGSNDSYACYYYYVVSVNGKFCLQAVLVGVNSSGEQISSPQTIPMEVGYSTDCFVSYGFSQYAFLVPKTSTVGTQLDNIYASAGRGVWLDIDAFVTAKGQYILVDRSTGIWAAASSISNTVYLANKNSGKLQASGVDIDAFGAKETVYCNTGELLSYNHETRMLQLYNRTTGMRRDANKTEVAPGVWGSGDIYLSLSGDLICLNGETGEANTIQLTAASYLASVYANGKELTYTYSLTDSLGKTQEKLAIYNFQQFYKGILFGSFEGFCELSDEEMTALRELDSFTGEGADERCILRMTISAVDAKGNERHLVYRFYRISERRAYITIESLDSAGAVSDSTKAYGNFYALSSYAEKIISDATRVVIGTAVDANSKY